MNQTIDKSFDIERLTVEQGALERQARLHWLHWFIIGGTLFITVFAWQTSSNALEKRESSRFETEAQRVINLMRERIYHYEDALLSGVAAMQALGGDMSRKEWNRYARFLDLTSRYPGVNGIGVIFYVESENMPEFLDKVRADAPDFRIHPQHPYDLSLPITYIEPEGPNKAAVGLDVAFEKNRRSAALYARTTGLTQISGPIQLVQDEAKTPGFLFYAPYYDPAYENPLRWTDEQREERFRGLVYAPLVVRKLVDGVLSADQRSVLLTIRDGEDILYTETPEQTPAEFHLQEAVELHGRTWTFEIQSLPLSTSGFEINQPTIVLISGLCLETMLIAMFCLMSRANQRTLAMAKNMTDTLASQAMELTAKNLDLESFAYVVSHDLKAPIRNIQTLVGVIDEDFSDYLASNDEGVEIRQTLDMVSSQVDRGNNLIDGILAYSRLGAATDQLQTVDTRELVEAIGKQHCLKPDQLMLRGEFPTLNTNAVLLEQVLSNLIGNAIKFNPDANPATVTVSVQAVHGNEYQFTVKDNGPGIEARFHERIFKQFTSVNTNPRIQSSGIGLSIVKRALDLQGGSITVDSAPGHGSSFQFSWPVSSMEASNEGVLRCA